MKTSSIFKLILLVIAATMSIAVFGHVTISAQNKAEAAVGDPQVKTAFGLQAVTFTVAAGTVTVNLPNDIRAGDTISGTVVTEPSGQTKEEQAKNYNVLTGLVIEIDDKALEQLRTPTQEPGAMIKPTSWIYHVDADKGDLKKNSVAISLKNLKGKEIGKKRIPVVYGAITTYSGGGTPTPKDPPSTGGGGGGVLILDCSSCSVPAHGQQGRPVMITGPFDGNSSNTKVTLQPATADVLVLAESRGKMIFMSPVNTTGPSQLTINEGGRTMTAPFRSLSVNLSAPKTNLQKGETTTLTVKVGGLAGITEEVPLLLEKTGVVTMEGGDVQTRSIKPSEVQADGSFTFTRTMTGLQAGGFSVTATVVGRPQATSP